MYKKIHNRKKELKKKIITDISEKGGCFICLWVKNESLVGPQQSQIGGIECSFFSPTGTFDDV